MNLYENAFPLFSMGYRDVSYISYKFIHRIVQKDQMYEMYETPLGCFIHTNHTQQGRKEIGRDNGVRETVSLIEGTAAEQEFINLRSDFFVRKATMAEDIHQHWDVMDREFGMVDVKAAKRKYRSGPIDYTIWWELRTVKRPPDWKPTRGWGSQTSLIGS